MIQNICKNAHKKVGKNMLSFFRNKLYSTFCFQPSCQKAVYKILMTLCHLNPAINLAFLQVLQSERSGQSRDAWKARVTEKIGEAARMQVYKI
jgi:hypothetical protein